MATARALLLDLDGVLRRWEAAQGPALEIAHGLPPGAISRAAFAPELLEPAIIGAISDDEWRRRIQDRLVDSQALLPAAAARAVAAWSEPCGSCDTEVLALVQEVRRRAPVCLVTNATSRLPADLERLGLGDAFDAVINSSQVGARKPDARIFGAAAQAVRVPLHEALFIDDTQDNVDAARQLGSIGYLYVSAAQLRRVLQWHGLLG